MISCTTFRSTFAPATEDAALLEHIRSCDACLDHAAEVDPDILFRAIGGSELIPPGGLDAFAADVMREVRLRSTEQSMAHRVLPWPQRLAIAATLAGGVIGGALFYNYGRVAAPAPMRPALAATALHAPQLTTKPIVETYDSATATIVEVPTEGASDVRVVMVFDEQLPADL
jgi:anti-sigma factor RsiW